MRRVPLSSASQCTGDGPIGETGYRSVCIRTAADLMVRDQFQRKKSKTMMTVRMLPNRRHLFGRNEQQQFVRPADSLYALMRHCSVGIQLPRGAIDPA